MTAPSINMMKDIVNVAINEIKMGNKVKFINVFIPCVNIYIIFCNFYVFSRLLFIVMQVLVVQVLQ
jgi:hypothetical protein